MNKKTGKHWAAYKDAKAEVKKAERDLRVLRARTEILLAKAQEWDEEADKQAKLLFDNNKSWPQSGEEKARFITERVHVVADEVRAARWPDGVPADEMGEFRVEVEKHMKESLKAKPWQYDDGNSGGATQRDTATA